MPLTPPMMVRNNQAGPLVFSATGDSNDYLEFAGAGDPNGGDVQAVPGELQNNVQFRRILTLGLVTVEDQMPDIKAALAGQRAEWESQQAKRNDSAIASLDQVSDNDILSKECIGPGLKPGEHVCATPVPQRADAVRVHPPLCQMHKHMAGEYVAKETGRIVGNRNEVVWIKASGSE